jgi:hypothetical protein
MNCRAMQEQIIAQSGRAGLSAEMERHVWVCPACSQVYLEQQALWRAMDAWEVPEVSAGFDRRLFARIGKASPWAPVDWLLRLVRPLQPAFPAALACVVLMAAVVVNRVGEAPAGETTAVIRTVEREEVQQIETALDDIQMLRDLEIASVDEEGS